MECRSIDVTDDLNLAPLYTYAGQSERWIHAQLLKVQPTATTSAAQSAVA